VAIKVKVKLTKSGYESVSKTSAPANIPRLGTEDSPAPWGSSMQFEDGQVKVTVFKPIDVTSDIVAAGALPPATGNAYWIAKVTILNDTMNEWRWGNHLGFVANSNGKTFTGMCGADTNRFVSANWPTWEAGNSRRSSYGWESGYVKAPARNTTSRFLCVEAPTNAFESGKFAVYDRDANWYYFK